MTRHAVLPLIPLAMLLGNAADAAVPTAPSPGAVERSVRQPAVPLRQPGQLLLPAPTPDSGFDPDAPRFRVNAFEFSGNTRIDTMRLKRLLEGFIDLQLNLYDLTRAADWVSAFYQTQGYPLARALIPAQRVVDGRVRIEIVEGRLGTLSIDGTRRLSPEWVRRYGGILVDDGVIEQAPLETKLLRLNDLPGVRARAVLRAGTEYGTTDLNLQIDEQPIGLDLTLTNAARKDIGQNRLDATVNLNSPTGAGDRLAVRALVSERRLLRFYRLSYDRPFFGGDWLWNLSHSQVEYDIRGPLSPLKLGGQVKTSETTLTRSLIRSREHDRSLYVGLSYKELAQTAFGIPIQQSRLPLANAGWNERWVDRDGTTWNWKLAFSGNGRDNAAGLRQDAERLRTEMELNATARLDARWDIYARANWIYSAQRLPDADRFDVGGPDSVRAYRPSELRGDSGAQVTLEFRRNFNLLGRMAQASVFVDHAQVIYKLKGFRNGNDEIGGVGVGLTVYPAERTTFKLQVAKPFSPWQADDGKRKERVWFNLSSSF
jgi:hemolysin activation/secretion protein